MTRRIGWGNAHAEGCARARARTLGKTVLAAALCLAPAATYAQTRAADAPNPPDREHANDLPVSGIPEALAQIAGGSSDDRLSVRISGGCTASELRDIASVLRVELGSSRIERSVRGDAYEIGVDCLASGVNVNVAAPARPNKTYATSLIGVPANMRPRIVALAIAEIVRDLDRESRPLSVATLPTIQAPPDEPSAAIPARRSLQTSGWGVRLGAMAAASDFRRSPWLVGGGLRVEIRYGWVCAGLDALVLTSAEDAQFSAGTARALLRAAGVYAGWTGATGHLHGQLGGGYSLGVAKIAGRASGPGSSAGLVEGIWAAPYAFGSLAWALSATLRVELRGQIGWVTSAVVGEEQGQTAMDLGGLWTSEQLGVALSL